MRKRQKKKNTKTLAAALVTHLQHHKRIVWADDPPQGLLNTSAAEIEDWLARQAPREPTLTTPHGPPLSDVFGLLPGKLTLADGTVIEIRLDGKHSLPNFVVTLPAQSDLSEE